MGKLICAICRKMINENFRVDVFARHLGSMKILENYHTNCWDRLVKKNRESLNTVNQ